MLDYWQAYLDAVNTNVATVANAWAPVAQTGLQTAGNIATSPERMFVAGAENAPKAALSLGAGAAVSGIGTLAIVVGGLYLASKYKLL